MEDGIMTYSFSQLKAISINYNNIKSESLNFSNEYNFGYLANLAKSYINAKLPYASIRNSGKAKVLSKVYGVGEMSKNVVSMLTKSKNAKLALNMMLSTKYNQLKERIKKEGKSKGLRGRALAGYIRKQLKSDNLRRFGK